jgi:peroxiredoxin Q/BCP
MSNTVLKVGQPAPLFEALADDGSTIRLSTLRGKNVIVYFYPKDDTPGCTKEACQFRDNLDALADANTVVLGVSPDSVASHVRFRKKYGLNFSLLADTDRAIADAWGVNREKKMMYGRTGVGIVRTTVLVGPDGNIRAVWDEVKVEKKVRGGVELHVDEVRAALGR